jgi:uncharacterized membrane protein
MLNFEKGLTLGICGRCTPIAEPTLLAPLLTSVILISFALWLDRTLDVQWYCLILGATVAWGLLRGGLFCVQQFVIRWD